VARLGRSDDEKRAVAAEIINTLDACEVAHGVIVFDDLHRVGDPAFFGLLDLLIGRMSSRWTLALVSRTAPPLRLARPRPPAALRRARRVPAAAAAIRPR